MTSQRYLRTDRRTMLAGLSTGLGLTAVAGCTGISDGDEATIADSDADDAEPPAHAEYESTDVRVTDPDGDELGEVTAAIADTSELQRTGLSDTETLPENRGMLFVYDSVEELTFSMPEMAFPIDILFADDAGVITSIYRARAPAPREDGTEQIYYGEGQYVLEVVYEWTADRDVQVGDSLEFEL
ncbi:DUF192 domain-containing protein [Salinadaptatus halalkaliphilus]|uniref:DUF192 domain-containing protein n=1 Tax=Salinadaptatus halalkaliphilus TaxID=2419781 RepID=A0A4S3TQK6_9EURY|nr:DUF192 domain-containing protein [Salinadaptatus halalkaliphilus]THE66684.1 DUF192 domain-containing protein [Salinadaptatus halalkaliphilus]